MKTSPRIAIAYHSRPGTHALARAVRTGAEAEGAVVTAVLVEEMRKSDWETLDAADAIVFGAPTLLGSASGAFQVFAESAGARRETEFWKDKIAAGFTHVPGTAGDKHVTLGYLATLADRHRMYWVSPDPARERHADDDGGSARRSPGRSGGAGTDGVHEADIASTERLGGRVARHTAVVLAGRATLGRA